MRREQVMAWFLALLALVPALLFAYMGQFSRFMADDYCHIARGGIWRLRWCAYQRELWNGAIRITFFTDFWHLLLNRFPVIPNDSDSGLSTQLPSASCAQDFGLKGLAIACASGCLSLLRSTLAMFYRTAFSFGNSRNLALAMVCQPVCRSRYWQCMFRSAICLAVVLRNVWYSKAPSYTQFGLLFGQFS